MAHNLDLLCDPGAGADRSLHGARRHGFEPSGVLFRKELTLKQFEDRGAQVLRVSVLFVLASCFLLGLESYRGEQLQVRRTEEQRQLLARLESLGRASVLQLAADWRLAFSEPNEYQLEELRGLVEQLQSDPAGLESRP